MVWGVWAMMLHVRNWCWSDSSMTRGPRFGEGPEPRVRRFKKLRGHLWGQVHLKAAIRRSLTV